MAHRGPVRLVNKAGSWYLVADVDGHPPRMFNTSRIEERDPLTDVAVLRPD